MKKGYLFLSALALIATSATAQIQFVDLGLPSGTLWANMNVGAQSEEEVGTYVSWGETEGKSAYSWADYKWCDGTQSIMTKYVVDATYGTVDNKTVLDAEDDIATTVAPGAGSPTIEQFAEILDKNNCTWTAETINNRKGARVTGPNGNSIFIPAGGFWSGTRLSSDNSAGCLWSCELKYDPARYYYNANVIRFGMSRSGGVSIDARDHNGAGFVPRNYGYNVRAVKQAPTSGIDDITTSEVTVARIYNISGVELAEPAEGLNIVVYTDGTTKKIIVR